ncbi:MAG: ribonuclease P protein component [Clostridia bacterium]|nr:ribonuclease P protein component [Clostridiales bacterium]MBO5298612.1 ribonuclease P protein component [Clostridia bacterium]MBP3939895.1 ribonuclease P protein component [Christensenellaceae bacterium]MBR3841715.1 ribonuclease P protein component [Christensenellaceae bacterium]
MRINTLKRNKEFRYVYGRGNSLTTRNLVLVFLKRKSGGLRPGFSISKKIGGAVERNRLRRQLKAAYQEILKKYTVGNYHIIFIARQPIREAKFETMLRDMKTLMKKSGILGQKIPQGNKD